MTITNKYYDAGHFMAEAGDYLKAIQHYTQAIRLQPKHDGIYFDRGKAKFFIEDYKGALKDFSKALEINPLNFPAYVERGLTRTELGQWEAAIEDYVEALEINPADWIAYYNRGEAHLHLEDYEQAVDDFETAAKIALSQGDILHYKNIRYRSNQVITSLGYAYEDTEDDSEDYVSAGEMLLAVSMVNFSYEPVPINLIKNITRPQEYDTETEVYFQWKGKWYFVPK